MEVVKEYPDVFPRLSPNQCIKFIIDLLYGANPFTRALYRLAPSEMEELMAQLQELLENSFIRPKLSVLGASIFFLKRQFDAYAYRLPIDKSVLDTKSISFTVDRQFIRPNARRIFLF